MTAMKRFRAKEETMASSGTATNKVLFTLGVEIEGNLTKAKTSRILESLQASLEAVALPNEEVRKADKHEDTYATWHLHDPTEERCSYCREIGVTVFPVED